MRLSPIPHTLYAIPLFFCLPALADGTININNPSAGTGWTFADSVVTITANGNYIVTGSSTTNRIVIDKNVTATITLNNANIHSAVASPFALSSDNTAGGRGSQVTLILSGSNETQKLFLLAYIKNFSIFAGEMFNVKSYKYE